MSFFGIKCNRFHNAIGFLFGCFEYLPVLHLYIYIYSSVLGCLFFFGSIHRFAKLSKRMALRREAIIGVVARAFFCAVF
jgi:hypothetical protein